MIEKGVKKVKQLYFYTVVFTAKSVKCLVHKTSKRVKQVLLALQVIQPIGTGFVLRFSWTLAPPSGLDLKVLLEEMTRQILLWTISAFQLGVIRYICCYITYLLRLSSSKQQNCKACINLYIYFYNFP